MKLNLWAWANCLDGYVNMDIVALPGIDTVHDMESFPFPFADNTFDEIYCSHVLEHVKNLTDTMYEIVRICKPWARIKVKVPYFANPNGWSDPTHYRLFTSNTFNYYTKECYYNKLDITIISSRIHFFSNSTFFRSDTINIIPDAVINLFPKIYERFFAYIFPAVEIHFLLSVNK